MTLLRWFLLAAVLGLALLAWGYGSAVSDPVVRRAQVTMAALPEGASLTAVLISDIHVAGPDMPPRRLMKIVRRINALRPDIVLIAGDLVSDKAVASRHYAMAEAVAPLGGLRPRLGTFAVLGNHDHWRDAAEARRALEGVRVRLLDNQAVRAGPLVIGGLDDAFTGHDDLGGTEEAMGAAGGAGILLSHSPDPFPKAGQATALMLAGHTHCGQIRLPVIGAISYMSEHGARYACGLVRERGKTLIVSAGLGTSILPLRLGAPPDMWVLTLRGR